GHGLQGYLKKQFVHRIGRDEHREFPSDHERLSEPVWDFEARQAEPFYRFSCRSGCGAAENGSAKQNVIQLQPLYVRLDGLDPIAGSVEDLSNRTTVEI